jgi:hypothetical protein
LCISNRFTQLFFNVWSSKLPRGNKVIKVEKKYAATQVKMQRVTEVAV